MAVPSTVDVLINGTQLLSAQADPALASTTKSYTPYGVIHARQKLRPGSYTDLRTMLNVS